MDHNAKTLNATQDWVGNNAKVTNAIAETVDHNAEMLNGINEWNGQISRAVNALHEWGGEKAKAINGIHDCPMGKPEPLGRRKQSACLAVDHNQKQVTQSVRAQKNTPASRRKYKQP